MSVFASLISRLRTRSFGGSASFARAVCIAMCLVLFSCLAVASADVIYVGPDGNDNRGTNRAKNRSTPFRTIQRGFSAASPGDVVMVLDGQYNGLIYLQGSGQRNAPITLRAENTHGAVIRGALHSDGISWVTIDGFDVSNRSRNAFYGTKGIRIDGSHHITIRNCRVHRCRGGGINCDQCDWLLIEWNIVFSNAFWEPGQHSGISVYQPRYLSSDTRANGIIIRNNTCYSNENRVNNPLVGRPTDGNGIVCDDFRNLNPGGNGVLYNRLTLVENNLCFLNGGQGIHCYRANRVNIINNTCYKNMKSFDFGGEVSLSESLSCAVFNNILFARPGKNVALQFDSRRTYWDYNIMFNGPLFGVNAGPSTIYRNPLFKFGTLRIRGGSPAINRAFDRKNVFPFDIDGRERIMAGRIDIGASEYTPGLDD